MATAVNNGHVQAAISFIKEHADHVYIELAKETEWSNPNNPDAEIPNITELQGSCAFAKAQQVLLVYDGGQSDDKNDTANSIMYKGHKWIVSSTEDAVQNNACYVLVSATVEPGEVGDITYHQTGIRLNTKFSDTIQASATLPSYILDKGTLIAYENHKELSLSNQIRMNVKYLIKF